MFSKEHMMACQNNKTDLNYHSTVHLISVPSVCVNCENISQVINIRNKSQ